MLKIEVPIDTQFSFHDIEDWHLYIGSLRNKASADILGIAKGTAYLMFDGKGIPDFPLGALNGFSIAAGIAASLVLGDEDSGLYARVSGSVDVGVSTAPLHFYGRMRLEGRIHLWILGLGASAQLDIEAPEPLYVKGEVCGSIDLWLTELKGCVGITIGNPHPLPDPEPLLTGLSLQSHSPALLEGQGAETPIDSSLGVSHNAGEVIPNIPIDSIPVLQMKYPPVFKLGSTGLKPSSTAPTLVPGSDGWFSLGGLPGQEGERQLRYEISNISISPALPAAQPEMPATWWQPSRPNAPADSQSADKGVNLALNSWIPIPFPRAYQRSEEQRRTIRNRFEVICRLIAPATAVLWTFNEQRAGYSPTGWTLRGLPWPDPPNTQRSQAPETNLQVHEAEYPYRNHLLVLDYAAKLSGQVLDPAKVVPSSSVADVGRALQLPFLAFFTGMANENSLSDEARALAKTFLDQAGNRERIVLESGDVAVVRLLLCGHVKQKVLAFTRLRAFDVKNNIVEDIPVPGIFVRRYEDLPASWRDNSGPWAAGVSRVFNFLADVYKGTHQLFLAEWKPKAPIARFELYYQLEGESQKREWTDPPALLLGVTETLTRAEVERVVSEESYQDDMVQVVVNSLEEGDKRPLFAPNTEYTVRVNYQGQIRKGSDTNTVKTKNFEQSFKFRTASLSPKRIHPWVLAMLPENDAGNHFTKDKVQFIFNDAAVIQLFKAYGKTLKAVLRKANGNHPSEQPAIDLPALQGVQALVLSPYVHSMLALVKEMPCIPQLIETEQHQVFTVDIPLERGSSYMLDIESTPAAEDPNTPLFRTAFTTSRFESAAELAAIVAQGGIGELPLRGALVLPDKNLAMLIPDDDAPSRTRPVSVPWVSDAEMEAALLLALESDLPPAKQPGATLLWSFGQPATPLAVLLDAPEPLMRSRPVPVEVETPTPDDDAIQHFQTGKQLWLEVVESGLSLAERIVYSTSGCRVLVFLKSGASGTMQLALRQYRHTLLTGEAPFADVSLLEMPIPQKAPWEY